jgi:hypothetical protein
MRNRFAAVIEDVVAGAGADVADVADVADIENIASA